MDSINGIGGMGGLSAMGLDAMSQMNSATMNYVDRMVAETINPAMSQTGVPSPMDKETFGASLVSSTLDTMNTDPFGSDSSSDYSFQKSVLGAYAGLGGVVDTSA